MMPQYELEEDFDFEGHQELRCGADCSHFDDFNRICWLSWHDREEGDLCMYGLKIDENGQIVYPDLSRNNGGNRTEEK